MGAAAPGGMGATPPPPELMEQTLAMLENPTLRNAITTAMLDNPQMMQQMMELNPQLRQLRHENPAMAQMLSNPQFLRTMMDPSVMRAMMTLQQSIGNDPNMLQSIQTLQEALGGGTTPGTTSTMFPYTAAGMANPPPVIPAGVPTPPVGRLDFSTLLQQTQNMNISHQQQQQQQQQQLLRRYDVLVSQLVDMGFDDREANLRALQATGGNINRAVDYLLENPSIPSTPITTTNTNNNNNEGGGTNNGDTLPDSTNNGQ
jgi:ubiquilin